MRCVFVVGMEGGWKEYCSSAQKPTWLPSAEKAFPKLHFLKHQHPRINEWVF